jgi:hypothetical protein
MVCFTLQPLYLRLAAWYCCGAGDRRDLPIALFCVGPFWDSLPGSLPM